ncbi:hypothetical protein NM688_g1979 [Phlebia brevispora]|uniref:Uncharacterized protein n=1 Tax=Phlebia brevispora TaxID=194682 RepID=A0ACC1T9N6_9APHY|nr:hypothetical protein NM688_g1979 [Phlebia brevispora]
MSTASANVSLPTTQAEWKKALDDLPSNPEKLPVFFFGHGSPMLAFPESDMEDRSDPVFYHMGPKGPLANFLKDFGPVLLSKYKPKAIVVFSAHWESDSERLVTDYGDENPLLYDYYGFPSSLYELKFKSRGDSALSQHIVQLFKDAGFLARTTTKLESRGMNGRGGRGAGLDHGVFVPFRLMFGEEFTDIPIVEVAMDGSLDPQKNWAVGQAVKKLREEQVLILSGGLTIHNLGDFSAFSESTANPLYKSFAQAILDAVTVPDANKRKQALINLTKHAGFRISHPRADHFVPIYIAAGAGEGGGCQGGFRSVRRTGICLRCVNIQDVCLYQFAPPRMQ